MPPTPRITVHHLLYSRTNRIFWCLEELGLPYKVKVHFRGGDGRAGDSLKQVSRLGKAPVLEMDGHLLRESGAIINTLLTRFSAPGIESPPGDSSVYWSHFAEGSLMLFLQPARNSFLMHRDLVADATSAEEAEGIKKQHAAMAEWARSNVQPVLEEVDLFLDQKGNFTGSRDNIGAGDFMMHFPLNSMYQGRHSKANTYYLEESTIAWVERMCARPAWQRAQDRRIEEERLQKEDIGIEGE